MVKLKLVAGKTYSCPPIFGSEVVLSRGEVVDVSTEHAAILLADFYHDALNNEHPYFKEVVESAPKAQKAPVVVEDDDDYSEEEEEATAATPRRARAAAK